jgi:hypothetical protein
MLQVIQAVLVSDVTAGPKCRVCYAAILNLVSKAALLDACCCCLQSVTQQAWSAGCATAQQWAKEQQQHNGSSYTRALVTAVHMMLMMCQRFVSAGLERACYMAHA